MDIFKNITESGFAVVMAALMLWFLLGKWDKKLEIISDDCKRIANVMTELLKGLKDDK